MNTMHFNKYLIEVLSEREMLELDRAFKATMNIYLQSSLPFAQLP